MVPVILLTVTPVLAEMQNYGYKLAGDANRDCVVNIGDAGTLNPYYGRERGDKPEDFAGLLVSYRGWVDLNKDGTTDMNDVEIVIDNWGSTCNSPNTEGINEPIDKITFIHYRDGSIRAVGSPAKTPTCYKLLGVKWKSLPVSYVINPDGYAESFVTTAISASTAEWDSYTSANLFGSYVIDYNATWDDTVEEVDYTNEYVFGPYPDTNVIAVTVIWYTRYQRQIVDYDILFNTYFSWADCTITDCTSAMDLQNIAVHETGHGIGLADIYDTTCSQVTMYGYSTYGEMTKRTIEQPDITGLQKLYRA